MYILRDDKRWIWKIEFYQFSAKYLSLSSFTPILNTKSNIVLISKVSFTLVSYCCKLNGIRLKYNL